MRNREGNFFVATFLFWASLYIYVPILSPYAEHLGGSLQVIGLIIGSYDFAQFLFRIPLGIWSDKVGKRKTFVIVGFILSIISGLGLALSRNPIGLLIFRGISGISAATWVDFTVLFSSYFDPSKVIASLSLLNFYSQIGQLVANLLSGFIAQRFGWTYPFYSAGIIASLGLIFSFFIYEKDSPNSKEISLKELLATGKEPLLLLSSVLAILLQYFSFIVSYGFLSLYATNIGVSKSELGILTFIASVPAAIASLLNSGSFMRRFSQRYILVFGFILTSISSIFIPFTKSFFMLSFLQCLGGIGRGINYPILMGLSILNIPEEKRSTAMGFFQALYGIGMFGGPFIGGYIGSIWGLNGIFISTGIVVAVAAILSNCISR
ncbi:MAG: MFS transporter [bacterium]